MARDAKNFNCETCTHRHCDADYALPGSRGPAGFDRWSIPGVIESRTCLLPMITAESRLYLRLHAHYRNGLLPLPGSLYEQPEPYLRAMELLENLANG